VNAPVVAVLEEFWNNILNAAGAAQAAGNTTKAVGRAFHGITTKDKPTLEKPALSVPNGSAPPAATAAVYGRKPQLNDLLC